MKKTLWLLCIMPLFVRAQTVEVNPVDIIYGDKVIHGRHQVVLSSPEKVAVIPVEKSKSAIAPNVVISAPGKGLSYIEEGAAARREQAIYDEVNKRTEEAPFTVLFTGNIPPAIEEKRLRMMPEIGIFSEQLNKEQAEQSKGPESKDSIVPDTGEFSAISPNGEKLPEGDEVKAKPMTEEEKLEKLIGG